MVLLGSLLHIVLMQLVVATDVVSEEAAAVGRSFLAQVQSFDRRLTDYFKGYTVNEMKDFIKEWGMGASRIAIHMKCLDWFHLSTAGPAVCEAALPLAIDSPLKALEGASWSCLQSLFKAGLPLNRISGARNEVVKEGAQELVDMLRAKGWSTLGIESIKKVLSQETFCKSLLVGDLLEWTEAQRALIDSRCFIMIEDIPHQSLSPSMVRSLSDSVFSKVERLHVSWYDGMTPIQFRKLCENENSLPEIPLTKLRPALIQSLDSIRLGSILRAKLDKKKPPTKLILKHFPLGSLDLPCHLWKAVQPSSLDQVEKQQFELITATCPELCQTLSKSRLQFLPGPECLASMDPKAQLTYLAHEHVRAASTRKICISSIAKWGTVPLDSLLTVLNRLPHDVTTSFGEDCSKKENPGSLIDDVALWKRHGKTLATKMGPKFLASIPVLKQLEPDDVRELAVELFVLLDPSLAQRLKPNYLRKSKAVSLGLMDPTVCTKIDFDLFNDIPLENVKYLTFDCVKSLPFNIFSNTVLVHSLSPAIFEQVDAELLGNPLDLTPAQLSVLSNNLSPGQRHAATVFTAEHIENMQREQRASLSATFLDSLPDKSFLGLSKPLVNQVPPKSLSVVSLRRARQMSEHALMALSPEHAEYFGSNHCLDKASPDCPFILFPKRVLRRMEPEARNIMAKRLGVYMPSGLRSSLSLGFSLCGFAFVFFAATAIFAFRSHRMRNKGMNEF